MDDGFPRMGGDGGMPQRRRIDPLFALIGWNAAMGAGLGALFTSALIWFDAAKIATLASRQGIEFIAYLLLFVGFTALGAGVMVASAIMMQRPDDDASQGGGHGARRVSAERARGQLSPVPVRSQHRPDERNRARNR
jgi:hypothetical protein